MASLVMGFNHICSMRIELHSGVDLKDNQENSWLQTVLLHLCWQVIVVNHRVYSWLIAFLLQ